MPDLKDQVKSLNTKEDEIINLKVEIAILTKEVSMKNSNENNP